jgi:RND family efflux transporter MFP subunit
MPHKHRVLACAVLPLLLPTAALLLLAGPPLAPSRDRPQARPVIVVETAYPGAEPQALVDTVAFPIEQEINRLENVRSLSSRCAADGTYTLHVHFEPGVDLNLAQMLVQNHVNVAVPTLPDAVRRLGITVTKKAPGVLLFVTLYSPDDSRGPLELGGYASIQIQDELSRVPGVGPVSLVGGRPLGLSLSLDLDRLASFSLTAGDVLKALREQNLEVTVGQVGQPALLPRLALGGDEVADIILRTGADGRVLWLRDVARLEPAGGSGLHFARLDGKPVVALGVSAAAQARPRELGAAVRARMARLKDYFPPGIDYAVPFDFTSGAAPADLLVELGLPAGISRERILDIVERCGEILRQMEGVQHVLSLSENPFTRFRGGPCLVLSLSASNRERLTRAIRTRLEEVEGVEPRLRELSGPGGYPVDFALRGPEVETVRELGNRLVERLARTGKLTDLAAGPGAAERHVSVEVDRTAAQAHGVSPADIADTLDVYLHSVHVNDFNRFGRTWKAQVRIDGSGDPAEDVKRLKVRNARGELVALSGLVTVRERTGPGSIDRLDFQPVVEITANPAPGVSPGQARWLCETLTEAVRKELSVSPEYGLVWLQELPAAKPIPGEPANAGADAPPPEVQVSKPVVREVTDYADFTGRTQAVATVDLRARVTGYLAKVSFEEGSRVKKGDVLFWIDPRPYEEALKQAKAGLEKEKAQLARSEVVYQRQRALAAKKAIGPDDLEQSQAERDAARAAVAAAEAAVAVAQLNVEWCTVRAPIDGRSGRSLVDPGNLVKADETTLATLVSQDPIYVYFDMDERTALQLLRLAGEGKIKSPREGETPILMGTAGEEGFPRHGTVNFVDNRVDPNTGTLRVRAVFPNTDGMLLPGLFVRVRLPVGAPHKALLVPEEAVGSDQGQKYVFVVGDQDRAVYRRVHVGAVHDGLRVIEEGLQPGDRVIVGGLKRVQADRPVKARAVTLPAHR